jgi:hypothetical protein
VSCSRRKETIDACTDETTSIRTQRMVKNTEHRVRYMGRRWACLHFIVEMGL